MEVKKVVANRHFCNKLWNATRFALGHFNAATAASNWTPTLIQDESFQILSTKSLDQLFTEQNGLLRVTSNNSSSLSLDLLDSWILGKLHYTVSQVNSLLEAHDFAEAANRAYSFFLYDFCDSYIEFVKNQLMQQQDSSSRDTKLSILLTCLDASLKLLHPFMPFVTEELWHRLPAPTSRANNSSPSLMVAPFPAQTDFAIWSSDKVSHCIHRLEKTKKICDSVPTPHRAQLMGRNSRAKLVFFSEVALRALPRQNGKHVLDVITNARSLRQLLGYTREVKSDLVVETDDVTLLEILRDQEPLIKRLSSISGLQFRGFGSSTAHTGEKQEAVRNLSDTCRVFMRAPTTNNDAEILKTEKLLQQIKARQATLVAQISGATYATRVPVDVQQKNSKKLSQMEEEIQTLEKTLSSLRNSTN